jgi:hypothetical protein
MPEILNISILDLSRCQVPINVDLVNVNSAKRARSPVVGNAVLGSATYALISSNPVSGQRADLTNCLSQPV